MKEKIYDEQINPLMKEIIQICKDNDISFYADFKIGAKSTECCVSGKLDDIVHVAQKMIRDSSVEEGINMDKFLFGVEKSFGVGNSILMRKVFNRFSVMPGT